MKKLRTIVIFLSILLTSSVYAQKGTVKGIVTDEETGETIPFLNVYTADKSNGTTTDFDGNYEMELEVGTYELTFSSLEYGKTTKTVTVASGQTVTLDMNLETADIKMETILVKSDKYAKPIEDVISSMEIIRPDIIESKAATDVSAALEQAPGLTIVDNEPQLRAGSGYSFGAGSRVMILVDGLPLLSGDAGRPSWSFIPTENIEQIEVIKGASSVLYGSAALNGVINIRTAYPTKTPKTVVTLNSGVWDKPKLEKAKWWGADQPFYTNLSFLHSKKTSDRFSYTVGGNAYLERGYLGPAIVEELTPENLDDLKGKLTPEQYADTLSQIQQRVTPGGFTNRVRINFTTRIRAKKIKGLTYGINGNFMYSRSTTILLWENDTTGLYRSRGGATTITKAPQLSVDPFIKYFDKKGNTFSLNTRLYYLNNNNNNNQQNSNTVYYGEFRYLRRMTKIRDFTVSAGSMIQYVRGTSELFAAGDAGAVDRTQTNIAFYAQLDKKILDRINFTLGGRWEYFKEDTTTASRPIFRAGVSARIAKATYLRGSFGQGFRFPTISEKYISTDLGGFTIVDNPSLVPESSWSLEVGIKQGIKINKFLGYIDVAGFTNYYNNYIEFIANAWPDRNNPGSLFGVLGFKSLNTGQTRVSGVDVSIMGRGNLSDDLNIGLLMGYTWARPVSLNPNLAYAVNNAGNDVTHNSSSTDTSGVLKYRFEHLVKFDVELNYKKVSTGFSFRLYSKMKNVDKIFIIQNIGNAIGWFERNDGAEFVMDWRVGYSIGEHSKVAFIINNMLNREYALRPLVINAPRSFILQYTLKI